MKKILHPTPSTKLCGGCKKVLSLSNFTRNKTLWDGLSNRCGACQRIERVELNQKYPNKYAAKKKEWRHNNRERVIACKKRNRAANPEKYRDTHFKWLYGITRKQYDEMLSKQDGRCAICGGDNGKKRLCIDHCHSTGKIRGMLCLLCNTGLGVFRDNCDVLAKAIIYLKKQ